MPGFFILIKMEAEKPVIYYKSVDQRESVSIENYYAVQRRDSSTGEKTMFIKVLLVYYTYEGETILRHSEIRMESDTIFNVYPERKTTTKHQFDAAYLKAIPAFDELLNFDEHKES